jgi:hypothetical protein
MEINYNLIEITKSDVERLNEIVKSITGSLNEDNWTSLHGVYNLCYNNERTLRELERDIVKINKYRFEDIYYSRSSSRILYRIINNLSIIKLEELKSLLNRLEIGRSLKRYLLKYSNKLRENERYDFLTFSKKVISILTENFKKPLRDRKQFYRKLFHFKFKNLDDCDSLILSDLQFIR